MQFSVVALLSIAVAVSAQFNGGSSGSPAGGNAVANTAQACGNGQKYSCCNTTGQDNSILGGNCEIPILGQSCAGGQAFCCGANQEGLINVGSLCLPITA